MITSKFEKLSFFVSFLIISLIVIKILDIESNERLNEGLSFNTKQVYHDYQVFFESYEKLSRLVYDTKINKPKVLELFMQRDRQKLHEYLLEDYKLVKAYNIVQLHFHTNKNISFLRMHRPEKFGDDLTNIRPTVKYVNEEKKFISGFEEGRIFNGFRFVYPLKYKNKYLGTVEISFSGLFFIEEILKNNNISANLLISKDVVDTKVFSDEHSNYVESSLDNFYFQKMILEKLKTKRSNYKVDIFDEKLEKLIKESISKGNPFSIYNKQYDLVNGFIPLKNPITKKIVAAIQIDSKDKTLKRHLFNVLVIKIILIILLALLTLLVYKIYFFQRSLKLKIKEKTKELNDLNENLKLIVQKEIDKNKEKDELMIIQSRHAAMGEMISMIAHQWRQPIAVVSMAVNNILIDLELGMVNEEELKDLANDILEQTNYLSKTIDDFRDFFKPEKKKDITTANKVVQEALSIVGKSFENNNINFEKDLKSNLELNTFSRELLQVVLNILKNAKEALVDEDLPSKNISIKTFDDRNGDFGIITIEDNAGGIDDKIKESIFQPYFSTKEEKAGTGLGLYMSKTIIEKHIKGSLSFENTQDGVCFIIKVPKTISD